MLRTALDGARSLAAAGSTLSFRQRITLRLLTPAGELVQELALEGDIRLLDGERYSLRETWGGSALEGEQEGESLSYITLDGGRSAYVKSSRLEKELDYSGWVYLPDVAGRESFLDYLSLLENTAGKFVELSEGGIESLDGRPCRRLLLRPDVQALLRQQMEADPALRERLEGEEGRAEISDARSEIWLDEEDLLPRRVYSMMSMELAESGERFEVEMCADFHSYGAELRPPLDAPAVYTVVELP